MLSYKMIASCNYQIAMATTTTLLTLILFSFWKFYFLNVIFLNYQKEKLPNQKEHFCQF